MVDLRAELAALVAAYDKHRKWTLNAVFEGLHQAVEHARAVLAQPEPAPAADGEVAELPPRPPLMEPPAHLALERYGITWDGSPDKPLLTRRADGYWTPWHVAADLLERQATAAPVARLPEDAQVIEPVNRIILAPVPTPIPVSERPWERQGWCNKDGRCWFGWADEPDASWSFCKPSERDTATVSLAAHALPLPEVE